MQNLLELTLPQLADWFAQQGEKPFRARQLMKWLHQAGVADFMRMSDLSKGLREKLQAAAVIAPPLVKFEHASADGTRKWLFDAGVGNGIEAVFIPEDDRGTLCISSQVGCALECRFCSTGRQGFNRNLGVGEIVGQLWHAQRALRGAPNRLGGEIADRPVSNVVMMGMGEPLANFENVAQALEIMLDDHAYGLSRRRVTVSTAGLVPAMERLAQRVPVALAVSLHAPNDALRDELVPINRKYPIAQLLAACERYLAVAPRDFITFEYVMLDGVNDRPQHAAQLAGLLCGIPSKLNLIPFNPFAGAGLRRSPMERVLDFQRRLQDAGYVATVRKTRGDDINAACGQLAGQVQDKTGRVVQHPARASV